MEPLERFLAGTQPFKALPPAELATVARSARLRSYAKGQTIFQAGQESDTVWVVKTGRVHLMKFLADGKASTMCVMTAGDPFCCLPALDRKPYPVDAVAAVASTVVAIPQDAFHRAMSRSPGFSHEALCLFCDRLRQVERKSCMIYEPAEARLAQVLSGLVKKFGTTIPLTRHELAEIAGTTHETAIRVLSRLRRQGLIRSVRGKTTIVKPEQLEQLAKGE